MDSCGKSATIDDLPPEILVQIFSSYVKSERNAKLYTVVSKVSMTWRKAALTPSLWTEASFIDDDFIYGHSWLKDKDVLERISFLKSLHFCYTPHAPRDCDPYGNTKLLATQALQQILENSWNLENFDLTLGTADRYLDLPHFLVDLPTLCPKITGIQIKPVEHRAPHQLLNWVEKYNKNLTRLLIGHIDGKARDLTLLSQKIAEYCPNMTTLEFTSFTWCNFDLKSLQAKCHKLRELSLQFVWFTDIDDSTPCVFQLEKLSYTHGLHKCESAPQNLVWILKGSTGLKELKLCCFFFHDESMLQLPCKFLKTLSVSRCSCIRDLYNMMCQWKHSLTKIHVQCISDENQQQSLFRYIEEYGKDMLESLSLTYSFWVQTMPMKRVLRQCRKLTFLRITAFKSLSHEFSNPVLLCSRKEIDEWLDH